MLATDLHVELQPDEIALDAGLTTVIGLNDAALSELRRLCERRFHVQISDADFTPENFSTVRRLAYLILELPRGSENKK
jgi:acyl carrier protein